MPHNPFAEEVKAHQAVCPEKDKILPPGASGVKVENGAVKCNRCGETIASIKK